MGNNRVDSSGPEALGAGHSPAPFHLYCAPDANEAWIRLRLENQGTERLEKAHLHINLVRGVRRLVGGDFRLIRQTGSHCVLTLETPLDPGSGLEGCIELEVPVARLTKLPLSAYLFLPDEGATQPVGLYWSRPARLRPAGYREQAPALIPWPRYLEWGSGHFRLGEYLLIGTVPAAQPAARWLAEALADHCHLEAGLADSGPVQLREDPSLAEEQYILDVANEEVRLLAGGQAGFVHGVAVLLQLLPANPLNHRDCAWWLPCVHIEDEPAFPYRGLMLDCARHFHPVPRILRLLDLMARLRLNVFHWHLTDDEGWRLEIKAFPELTEVGAWRGHAEPLEPQYYSGPDRHGGYYSQEDVARVVNHARDRGITVVPEIDVPAHSRAAIKALPQLLCDPEDGSRYLSEQRYNDNVLSPALDGTYEFLDAVLDEVCRMFPGPLVHVGGDEVPAGVWANSPRCRAMMEREGYRRPEELTAHLLRHVQRHLRRHGKRMLGWEEVLRGPLLEPDFVAFAWTSRDAVPELLRCQAQLVLQPSEFAYFDLAQGGHFDEPGLNWAGEVPLHQVHSFRPRALTGGDAAAGDRILGVQAALWSELVSSRERMDYMLFPRLTAFAEVAWHAGDQPAYGDYLKRLDAYLPHLDRLGVNYRRPSPVED